jgi:hypothetical protein
MSIIGVNMRNEIILLDPITGKSKTVGRLSFAELKTKELQDLEKWIESNPDILGVKLLIITSEYDKFDKSDKRLDLLAIDEDGTLTVIELKRDAAGTLADLQAIRYAAFCSTMTLDRVTELRSDYTKKDKETAEREIREFVGDTDLLKQKPRIILAAGGFDDQELTSCVLWLRQFGVDISCVEITPYRTDESPDLILVPRVIIPLPETEQFMIGAERKEAEETRASPWEGIYQERNKQILAFFASLSPQIKPREVSGKPVIRITTGHSEVRFEWVQRGKRQQDKTIDVAVQFQTPSKEDNQDLCRLFKQHEAELTKAIQSQGDLKETFTFNEDWGDRWASVYLRKLAEPWTQDVAQWAAEKMHQLIPVAQSLIDQFYDKRDKTDTSVKPYGPSTG